MERINNFVDNLRAEQPQRMKLFDESYKNMCVSRWTQLIIETPQPVQPDAGRCPSPAPADAARATSPPLQLVTEGSLSGRCPSLAPGNAAGATLPPLQLVTEGSLSADASRVPSPSQ